MRRLRRHLLLPSRSRANVVKPCANSPMPVTPPVADAKRSLCHWKVVCSLCAVCQQSVPEASQARLVAILCDIRTHTEQNQSHYLARQMRLIRLELVFGRLRRKLEVVRPSIALDTRMVLVPRSEP